jgi:hypothetical protein
MPMVCYQVDHQRTAGKPGRKAACSQNPGLSRSPSSQVNASIWTLPVT